MAASASAPVLWIIAGPNGSGKTTAHEKWRAAMGGGEFWIINPDILAKRVRDIEGLAPNAANLQAVKRIEVWLRASIRAHQSVGVETVLSTDKYRRLVRYARRFGFRIHLTYVILDSPERSIARVALRASKGGHDVPVGKIVERYARSLAQLPWFLEAADQALLLDNSGAEPRLLGEKLEGGEVRLVSDAIPALSAVLQAHAEPSP